jgi:cholest-4-en-3-one 26-monooxygenase
MTNRVGDGHLDRVETMGLHGLANTFQQGWIGAVIGHGALLRLVPYVLRRYAMNDEQARSLPMTATDTATPRAGDIDIASPHVYEAGVPHEAFAELRSRPGLYWHPFEGKGDGFWAVTRYADLKEVSRHPEIFSSAIGHSNIWDLDDEALEARRSIIDSDPPDHTRLRRVVSRAFTPRQVGLWEQMTRDITRELLDQWAAAGRMDAVEGFAAPLPIKVIIAILGIPDDLADHMVELSDHLVEGTTGDQPTLAPDAYGNTTPLHLLPFESPAAHALYELGARLGAERLANPTDDLTSALVHAEVGGDRLTPAEFRNFFQILVFGGNETTRTALSHGLTALAERPDQWDRLVADPALIDPAVEEIIRWASPITHMRRTAAVDTELAGTPIKAGDKIVMWYPSANRDEAVFDNPMSFDVGRIPNEHQAFGAGGPHFCLGASLARLEIKVVLEEMLARGVRPADAGEPVRIASNFVAGIKSVQMSLV